MEQKEDKVFWEHLLQCYRYAIEKRPKREYDALKIVCDKHGAGGLGATDWIKLKRSCYSAVVNLEQSSFEALHQDILIQKEWENPALWSHWMFLFIYEPAYFARAVGFIEQCAVGDLKKQCLGLPLIQRMLAMADKKIVYEQRVGLMGSFELILDTLSFSDLKQWYEQRETEDLRNIPSIQEGSRSQMGLLLLMSSKLLEQYRIRAQEMDVIRGMSDEKERKFTQSAGWGKALENRNYLL